MQPFLGFNDLTVGMTGQANQCHLALAAAHLPWQPHLVSCGAHISQGGCQGAAIYPPLLPHGLSVEDCKYIATSLNGNDTQMMCIRAHIYPPKPPNCSRVSNEFTICVYKYLINTSQHGIIILFFIEMHWQRLRHSLNVLA